MRVFNFVKLFIQITKEIGILMSKIKDVQDDVVALKAALAEEIAAVNAKIATLSAAIGAGAVATQADVDGLHADLTGIVSALKGETASVNTDPAPTV